jgi:phosphate starvation-inducible PhoH-like protein
MRGRTLNDSFIIMDEAQNTSPEQMKMILTRQGFNSKMVVTGDVTQIDLPPGQRSGLIEAIDVLRGVEGISFVQFDDRDVVRHNLVQKIVKAYERYNEVIGANRQMSLKLTDGAKLTDGPKLTDGTKLADSPKLTDGPPREAAPEPVTPSNTAA